MEVYGVVYLITNMKNGKHYVGQTIRTVEERFNEHAKKDSAIGRAIRRHGKKNFKLEILKTCATKAELDACEMFFIAALKTRAPNGYNLTDGGEGTVGREFSAETRSKLSEAQRGNKKHFGKHHTAETREKMSESHRGEKNNNYGKPSSKRKYSPYKNLVREMDARHITYTALTKLMGFSSYKHVSLKMCGKIRFTDRDKAKLVEIFGKPIEYLLARDDG